MSLKEHFKIEEAVSEKISEELVNEFLGLGPLKALLEDKDITEIMVNGPRKVYIEKGGKKILSEVSFENNQHLMYIIQKYSPLPAGMWMR